jgi:hypothetical protein
MLQDGQFLRVHALPHATRFILDVPDDPRLTVYADVEHYKLLTGRIPAVQFGVFIVMLQIRQNTRRHVLRELEQK